MFPKESFRQFEKNLNAGINLRATEWADDVNVYEQGKALSAQFRVGGCLMSRKLLMLIIRNYATKKESMHRYLSSC